nr:probable guanine nucleotide exchange factor MCF2L2 isoform X4 [Aotus nancymaae]
MAVEIIEQLHRQFAILSGGRGEDGAPIITFPEFSGFKHIPDEDFLNVMTYLTSIPSVEAASIGFVVVIDRRRDKWSSVKASLTRIAVAFPGNLQLIFILRPSRLIQRTFTDIGIKYYRNEFKTKVPIILLNSVSDLHDYIDKSQLTRELGGTLEYRHSQWVNHRTAIENFALTLKTTVQMLQTFGASLGTTELPRSMLSTEDLLMSHTRQRDKLQDELKLLGKQGATLLSCVREPATKYPNSKLNLNQLENVAAMERLLVQLHETEKAFSQFWSEHHLKLNQCLQLQRFEHEFCKVKIALDNLLEEQAEFTGIGDSVMHVEQLLKEHKKLEEKSQEPLEKAQLLALVGDQLIQSHHDAADAIRPRCVELRHLCDGFINENKKKRDVFGKSLELHRQLDKVSQWCEAGIYLLASQAVDKCQSREGVDIALNDIATFLGTAKEDPLLSPKEFYDEFELLLTLDAKAKAQQVLQRLGDVQEIFHKRQVSLMKLAAKQTRPVQPVAPHPESSPKWVSSKTSQPPTSVPLAPPLRTSEEPYTETELNSWGKGDHETNFEVKNEEVFESHRERGNLQLEQPARLGDLSPCRTFLKELEKCAENPELLAHCFLKRKEDLQIYFKYHKNLPRARAIWQECQDCAYFGVCQRQLDHKLPLFKYLRGPSQRLLKYQMLLKGLLDFKSPEDTEIDPSELGGSAKDGPNRTKDSAFSTELQQALAVMEDLIKSCELSVDLAAVTEYPDDIGKLGELLMHSPFSVWTIHEDRYKMKDLIRFKPSQRQVYLFEKGIVFCKIRMEPGDQGPSPHYSFKKSLKLMSLSIHQLGRGSHRKFEIANRNGLEKYILQAASKEIRDCWFSEISKLLMEQQKDVKDQGNPQFEMSTGKGSGVGCGPWIENMERAATSKEDPASSTGGVKVILQDGSQMRAKAFPESRDYSQPTTAATVQDTAKCVLQPANQAPPQTLAARLVDGHVTSQIAPTMKTPTTTPLTAKSTAATSPILHTLVTTQDTPNNSHTAAPVTEATVGPGSAPHSQPATITLPAHAAGTTSSAVSHTTRNATQPSNQTILPATLPTTPRKSTGGQKPVQPTHAPGTTAATQNTTGTAPPVSTVPAPTLAPQPTSARTGTYQVLNGSRLCIKAEMGIQLIVQDKESVFSPRRYFNIDPNATQASGNCGTRKSNLLLNFQGGFVNFTFTKDEKSYYISEVGAYLTVSDPETVYRGMQHAVVMFETAAGHSFKCVSEQSLQLSAHLQLKTTNVQLQAFDFEDDHFGNADECFRDRNRREIPVALGLSITGLLVILLTACLVARKRPSRGYGRM